MTLKVSAIWAGIGVGKLIEMRHAAAIRKENLNVSQWIERRVEGTRRMKPWDSGKQMSQCWWTINGRARTADSSCR